MNSSSRAAVRAIVLACLLLAAPAVPLRAQAPPPVIPPPPPLPPPEEMAMPVPPAPPCEGCYPGFRYDSTFRFGAHFNARNSLRMAHDTLHFSFVQFYKGPRSLWRLRDPDTWEGQGRGRWWDSLQAHFYDSLSALDMKVIYSPGDLSGLCDLTRTAEAHYGFDPAMIHGLYFMDRNTGGAMRNDTLLHGIMWAGVFPGAGGPPSQGKMAGRPVFTRGGLEDGGYYGEAGFPLDTGAYDLTLTIKADSIPDLMDPATVLTYARIYRRVILGQGDCTCNIYAPTDSVAVTKDIYLDTTIVKIVDTTGYRDIPATVRFPAASVTATSPLVIARGPGDTVTAMAAGVPAQVYTSRAGWFGWGTPGSEGTPGCERFCARLFNELKGRGYIPPNSRMTETTTEEGDIFYDVFTTHQVQVSFLRGRLAPRSYTHLARGRYDDFINRQIDTIFCDTLASQDTVLRRLIMRVAATDEQNLQKYNVYREVGSRVLNRMLHWDSTNTTGLWCNPMAEHATLRVMSGDLDSTNVRMMHMMGSQIYNLNGRIPVTYANPDSMWHSPALGSYYRAQDLLNPVTGQVMRPRSIGYNTNDDYMAYNSWQNNATDTSALQLKIHQMADLVNVARSKYRHIRQESYPVYSVVQVHGFLEQNDNGYTGQWYLFRPTTPEEITAQAWLALNCGVDGLIFSDFTYDLSGEFGVMHWLQGDPAMDYYSYSNYVDSLKSGDPYVASDPAWRLPKMWTGFNDRSNAVRRITQEFHDHILPVYTTLDRNGVRMSVHRGEPFASVPLIDTLYTRRVMRYLRLPSGAYINSTTDDPRDSTYIELTVFRAGPTDTNQLSHYVLLTNRRCWPVDTLAYSSYVDSLHPGNESEGFGAIDVRRPYIRLKNTLPVMADSFYVQRIGSSTVKKYARGAAIPLDFLEPGWGAMYRITPIPVPVSAYGTAYNNAVHGENPSNDVLRRDRIVVYERDSAVYLRTMDTIGRWGSEWLISDPGDTARATGSGRRRGHNMFPAFASVRNGTSGMVVWERRDTLNRASVEMLWLPALPQYGSTSLGATVRRRLSGLDTLRASSWMQLTPAVAGLDDGYLVAWAGHDYTTEVKAVRDNPTGGFRYDTSRTMRTQMRSVPPQPERDSAAAYPTLAYVRNYDTVLLNGGRISGTATNASWREIPPRGKAPDTSGVYHVAHLAYQQGWRTNEAWEIFYNQVGVHFPTASNTLPELWISETEDVTTGLPRCEFLHPSIAADSVRTGVAFTTLWNNSKLVTLRFRNDQVQARRRWATTAYKWGGTVGLTLDTAKKLAYSSTQHDYERPSLLMFPSRDRSSLLNQYEGGITWQWTNPPDERRHHQLMYRFGQAGIDTLPDGQHPTFIGVPYMRAFEGGVFRPASVFHRGVAADSFTLARGWGEWGTYYPGYLENIPWNPLAPFQFATTDSSVIHAHFRFYATSLTGACSPEPSIDVGIVHRQSNIRKDDEGGSPLAPPPIMPPGGPPMVVTHPTMRLDVGRTGIFKAPDSTVTIIRTIAGDDGLISWLDTQPWDNSTAWPAPIPANIFIATELVRASDTTVLWRSDTISARSVGGDTLVEEVEVPVYLAASPGTDVFIRNAATPTVGLAYGMSGEYHFMEQAPPTGGLLKIVRSRERDVPAGSAAITIALIPNPLRTGAGTLDMRFAREGTVRITIADMTGRVVRELGPLDVARPGEYALPVDLGDLDNGVYVVQAEMGRDRGATRITIIR